jgi:hypothetical protein
MGRNLGSSLRVKKYLKVEEFFGFLCIIVAIGLVMDSFLTWGPVLKPV